MPEDLRYKENGYSERSTFMIYGVPGMWILFPAGSLFWYLFLTNIYNNFLTPSNLLLMFVYVVLPILYVLLFVINRQRGYSRNLIQEKVDHGGHYTPYCSHSKKEFLNWVAEGKMKPAPQKRYWG